MVGLGQAGELGHVKPAIPDKYEARFTADPNPPCGCGGYECAESRASLSGLIRRLKWALSEEGVQQITCDIENEGGAVNSQTVETLREVYESSPTSAAYRIRTFADTDQDAFARWLLEDWAIMIGALFASLAPVLHPRLFVIGGGLTEMTDASKDWFVAIVRRVYEEVNAQSCFDSQPENCEITWSVSSDQGWRGAILMSIRAMRTRRIDGEHPKKP